MASPTYSPQAIRKLNRIIPNMVKASLVNQALKLKKIIGSTFEPSDSLKLLMGGIPQGHREKILQVFSDCMYKAFEAGSQCPDCAILSGKTPEEISECAKTVAAPLELVASLSASFKAECDRYLQALVSHNDIIQAVEQEFTCAFQSGIIDAASAPKALASPEMAPAPGAEGPTAPAIKDLSDAAKPDVIPAIASAKPEKAEIIRKLEEYTKLLGDPVAERVLRATLGLPMVATAGVATAAAEDEFIPEAAPQPEEPAANPETLDDDSEWAEFDEIPETEIDEIGPFNIPELKLKVADLLKSHDYSDEELQVMPVDCLVMDYGDKSDDEKAAAIADALDQTHQLMENFGAVSLEDITEIADMMAEDITEACALPGEFVFLDAEDSYCLTFCFDKARQEDMTKLSAMLVTAAARKEPSGMKPGKPVKADVEETLAIDEVNQIKELSSTNKKRIGDFTMKELKKAAPKLATRVREIMTQTRNSKAKLSELGAFLKMPLSDAVWDAYGKEGHKLFGGK